MKVNIDNYQQYYRSIAQNLSGGDLKVLRTDCYNECIDYGIIPFIRGKIENISCLELEKLRVQHAKLKYPQYDIRQGDLTKCPYKDNEFDVILDFSTIDHIPKFEKTLDEYTRAVSYIGIDGKFVCVFAVRRVAPGIMSLDQACPPETDETTDWKTYQSPDGALSAQIIPAKKNLLGNAYESRVEIRTEEGKLLKTADYTSEDGDHGLIVANTEWSPDSQFFIYSAYSSGGHSPWFSRVYFYNRNDNKLYDFSEASGFTVANDEFSVTAPDIVTFTVYTCVGMGPTTTKSFKLSDVIGNPPVNLPYCYE